MGNRNQFELWGYIGSVKRCEERVDAHVMSGKKNVVYSYRVTEMLL